MDLRRVLTPRGVKAASVLDAAIWFSRCGHFNLGI